MSSKASTDSVYKKKMASSKMDAVKRASAQATGKQRNNKVKRSENKASECARESIDAVDEVHVFFGQVSLKGTTAGRELKGSRIIPVSLLTRGGVAGMITVRVPKNFRLILKNGGFVVVERDFTAQEEAENVANGRAGTGFQGEIKTILTERQARELGLTSTGIEAEATFEDGDVFEGDGDAPLDISAI